MRRYICSFIYIYIYIYTYAGYLWSCIFVFFIAHWNMWNSINHWHKNTQLDLFLTLLSCNHDTTISINTNISMTWTLPMMSPALTSWNIDFAETTKLGGWLVFSRGSHRVGKRYTSSYDHALWPAKILERAWGSKIIIRKPWRRNNNNKKKKKKKP